MAEWDELDAFLAGDKDSSAGAPKGDWGELDAFLGDSAPTQKALPPATTPAPTASKSPYKASAGDAKRRTRKDFAESGFDFAKEGVKKEERRFTRAQRVAKEAGFPEATSYEERRHESTLARREHKLDRATKEHAIMQQPGQKERLQAEWQARTGVIPEEAPVGTVVDLEEPDEGKPTLEKLMQLEAMTPEEFSNRYPNVHKSQIGSVKAHKVGELAYQLGLQEEPPKASMAWFKDPDAVEEPDEPGTIMNIMEAVGTLGRAATGLAAGGAESLREVAGPSELTREEFLNVTERVVPTLGGGPGVQVEARGVPSMFGANEEAFLAAVKANPKELLNVASGALSGAWEAAKTPHKMPLVEQATKIRNQYSNEAVTHRWEMEAEKDLDFATYLIGRLQNPAQTDVGNAEWEGRYQDFLKQIETDTTQLLANDPMAAPLVKSPMMAEIIGQIAFDPLTWFAPAKVMKAARARIPQFDKLLVASQSRIAKSKAAQMFRFAPEAQEVRALGERSRIAGDLKGAENAREMADIMELHRITGKDAAKKAAQKAMEKEALAAGLPLEGAIAGSKEIKAARAKNLLGEAKKRGFVRQVSKAPKVGKGAPKPLGANLRDARLEALQAETGLEWIVPKGKAFKAFPDSAIPKGFMDALDLTEKAKLPDGLKVVEASLSALNRVWAVARTSARLNFAPKNALSGVAFGAAYDPLRGLNPKSYKQAAELTWDGFSLRYGSDAMKSAANARRAEPFLLPSGAATTRGEVFDLVDELGWLDLGEVDVSNIHRLVGEMGEGATKGFLKSELAGLDRLAGSGPGKALKATFEGTAQASETFQHLGVAVMALDDLKIMKDPVAKSRYWQKVADYTLDYRRMGAVQKHVLRNAVPFYSWQEAIGKYAARRLYNDPAFLTAGQKIMDIYKKVNPVGIPEDQLPGYIRNRAYGKGVLDPTWKDLIQAYGKNGELPAPGTEEHALMVYNVPWAGALDIAQNLLMGKVDPNAPVLESVTPAIMILRYLTAEGDEAAEILRELNPIAPQQKTAALMQDLWQLKQRLALDPTGAANVELQAIREFGPYWVPIMTSLYLAGRIGVPDIKNYVQSGGGVGAVPYQAAPGYDIGH